MPVVQVAGMENTPILQVKQERTADIRWAESIDTNCLVFVCFSFFNIESIFGFGTMGFQDIFGENILNVGALFFPGQYLTVKVVGMEMGGQYI